MGETDCDTKYTRANTAKLEAAENMAATIRMLGNTYGLPQYAMEALQKWKEVQDDK